MSCECLWWTSQEKLQEREEKKSLTVEAQEKMYEQSSLQQLTAELWPFQRYKTHYVL